MYHEMASSCSKRSYIEWCWRKERCGVAWLLSGMWQLTGMRRNMDKGRRMPNTLMDYWKNRNWRLISLNEKWLNMNKEVAYGKILKCTNKDQTRNLGKY